jgi:hypothetical protein
LQYSTVMKKGFSFLILVAAALVTLAFQAKQISTPHADAPMASIATPPAPYTKTASETILSGSRSPASEAQPLEIEEVEVQN